MDAVESIVKNKLARVIMQIKQSPSPIPDIEKAVF
jgi:hypothetical protein